MWKQFGYKRAALSFVLAYVIVGGLALGLYLILAAIMGLSHETQFENFNVHQDPAYLLAEKLYVPLNLLVWVAASWFYFKKPAPGRNAAKEALALATFWLLIVLPLDYVAYVVVQTPYTTLSAREFYIGQFPWIYLVYVALFVSPPLYVSLLKRRNKNSN